MPIARASLRSSGAQHADPPRRRAHDRSALLSRFCALLALLCCSPRPGSQALPSQLRDRRWCWRGEGCARAARADESLRSPDAALLRLLSLCQHARHRRCSCATRIHCAGQERRQHASHSRTRTALPAATALMLLCALSRSRLCSSLCSPAGCPRRAVCPSTCS